MSNISLITKLGLIVTTVGTLTVGVRYTSNFNNIEEAALAYGLTRVPEPEPVVEEEEIIEEEVNNQDEEC